MKNIIQVKTIARKHVEQLPIEHYWENRTGAEFDWKKADILGRLAFDGCILCLVNRQLRRIAPIAYIDWKFGQVGGILPNGDYAPTPHTEYSRKAAAAYEAIPKLFTERNEAKGLIAAAPDLLAALQMFVAQYEGNGHDEREDRPEMKAARAAIAKAKGKGKVTR